MVRPADDAACPRRAVASDRDEGSDALAALCAQTIRRTARLGVTHRVVALGASAEDRCRALGLRPDWRLPTPAGSLRLASRFLPDLVRQHAFDVVHAWGAGPASAAGTLRKRTGVRVLRTNAARADDPRARLDPPGSVAQPGALLLPPGPTRDEAAEALGLDPRAFTVALLSDTPGDGLAFSGVFSGGLLQSTAGSFALILARHAAALERAAAFKRRTALDWPLLETDAPVLLAARAAHVAWVAPGRPGRPLSPGLALAAGACHAAGIPVVTSTDRAPGVGGLVPGCAASGEHAAAMFCATYELARSPRALAEARAAAVRLREPDAEAFTNAVLARWRPPAQPGATGDADARRPVTETTA
ncbi:MAG: hypothetical protein EA378_05215 [Phycisphaerales bacterium]|nr:MAG: hypothetical protein EA378_05215 [Phycisphaerales bacterium]